MEQYSAYKRYYPDKWEAISALRRDTGLSFADANQIINELFGVTDDDEIRKADAEHEAIYQAQEEAQKLASQKETGRAGLFAGLWTTLKSILSIGEKDE